MRIEIKSDVFKGVNFKGLNFLIQIITYNNRYNLFVDISKVLISPLFKRLDKEDQDILTEFFNLQIVKSVKEKPDYFIVVKPKNEKEFTIDEGIKFLIQPVSIVLENSLNDSYFIESLIKHIDSSGHLEDNLRNQWIQFENAGGCGNVANFLKGKLQSFNNLPKENHLYLRCFVLLDSDKEYKSQPIKHEYIELEKFLKENGIIYHILEKRMMENYMPDDVFNEFMNKTHKDWVDAYLSLTNDQKDHLNISLGFTKKATIGGGRYLVKKKDLHVDVKNLYLNVSEKNYNKVGGGFKLADFKGTFPAKFINSHNVHKKSLLDKTKHQNNPNELQEILEKINQLI